MLQPVGYGVPSPAVESGRVLKAAPGKLFSLNVTSGASAGWILLMDANAIPGAGPVLPVWWSQIPANTTQNISWGDIPLILNTGITVLFSTSGPFTYTASNTAVFSSQTV